MLVLSLIFFADFGDRSLSSGLSVGFGVCCSPASPRLVFTQSSLVEQSTPVSHQISDAVSSVSGQGVSDGTVECRALWGGLQALLRAQLSHSFMTFRSVSVAAINHCIRKIVLSFVQCWLYRLLQKRLFHDPSLSGIQFTDKDLDILELGGT